MPRDNLHRCHHDGYEVEHREVHNMYGFYHHLATVEGQLKRAPEVRPFVLTRAFFAGSHKLGPVWTGDNMVSWDHMARSVPMLVSLALCGYSLVGADVPGFMGDPDVTLFLRWHQLGIWYPFYRAHAHLTTKRREPWLFGQEATDLVRDTVRLRYEMLPMWYTLAAEWAFEGRPMMRPAWYHDLDEAALYDHADDQFFVGEAVLVRAVAKATAKQVPIYLPGQGAWFDFWAPGAGPLPAKGLQQVSVHPAHVPVFVREGHLLFRKRRPRRSVASMAGDPYTLEVYGSPARGRLYLDDGATHAFKAGAFIHDELSFDGTTLHTRAYEAAATAGRGVERHLPKVPASGLRIERIVFYGLPRQPRAARVRRPGAPPAEDGRTLGLQSAPSSGTDHPVPTWTATLKDPAVLLGSHDWQVELSF